MRKLLMGLFCAVSLLATSAMAKSNDIVELGLGLRMLFNSDIYSADNVDVDYANDTYPIAGDQAMGFGLNAALGHRFDGRKGPYEVLVKYSWSTSSEDSGSRNFTRNGIVETGVTGTLSKTDVLFAFRLPSSLMPIPYLNHPNLYYDMGLGFTTLSYDYELSSGFASTIDRTGPAFNLGVGYRHELSEDWDLTARADFIFSSIQDIENAAGELVHDSPDANSLHLQIGLVRYFESLF